ncbi:hypothetical protein D3C83_64940 [compost metagenome]
MRPSGSTVAPVTPGTRASWGPMLFTTISWLPSSSSTCTAMRWTPLRTSSTELYGSRSPAAGLPRSRDMACSG